MRRMTFAVVAVVAALFAVLSTASVAGAQAPDATISVTGSATEWSPQNVTITTGETVRWSFDGSALPHNVRGTGSNWDPPLNSPIATDQDPVDYTFNAPGVYTFVCDVHGGMDGTVTVEDDAADPLENVLVFSKTAGFRHTSIDEGVAAIEALGTANDFNVDATEDSTAFTDANLAQYDAVVFLSTTGDVLNDTEQAAFERYIQSGGGFVGIHAAADTEYTWPWYGELVGGYFRSHPPGTPTATVEVEDADEPSTEDIPAAWTRTDEWYNFQHPTTPVVNGSTTTADYSPRARHVHVLATVDEGTYGEEDGNSVDDDHPVAWCSDFDGGRSWYTAMGHTEASFGTGEGNLRQHILGGLRTATGEGDCGDRRDMPPTEDEFQKVTLNNDTSAPMEIDVAEDGRAFYIEMDGRVQMWSPTTQTTTTIATIPVTLSHENGLLGIQLAPDFETTGHIYLAYSALPDAAGINRVSRFTLTGTTLGQEQIIYTWQHQRQECCHTGGSLDFGPDGNLYISTGDNTNPFAHGYNPTDERANRQSWDAQRTSANSNNPNGKILRIRPIPNATGTPGIGTTYTIPAGNMFDESQDTQNRTLPEIYAMGFRNPFRIHVDQGTGWVLVGDYGPDAGAAHPNRGPQGSVEFNVVKEPGFYGWPYCVRQNVPYHDITYQSNEGGVGAPPNQTYIDNGTYDCASPVNDSPNNTGLTNLPPAVPATMWMGYTDLDNRFTPDLGGGGAPMTGPRYYFDEASESETKFPAFYDGHWFIGEWNEDWVKTANLNDQGLVTGVACFAICDGYVSPMDLEFGPNGSLYVIEWGDGFEGNNPGSGVYRIDYVRGLRRPVANATASADAVPVGTEVDFSSAGSNDPDGTEITYLWDFDDGTTSTDPNPSHTFNAIGTYDVTLTVTDEAGDTAVDTVRVIVGNERPVVTVELPEDGKVADFGETIPYRVSVDDPDGGSTEEGTIDCADIRIEVSLGHDTHPHELETLTGCEGEFAVDRIAGHGSDANVFTIVGASYTDEGNGPAVGVTGSDVAIVQPRLKQAEFWATTGRTADSRATSGDPGVQNEATTDVGGTSAAAFIEDGDWISFTPYNLEDLDRATFRVASAGAGGTIELRYDAADGPLVAATPLIAPTGGWQTWTDVTIDMPETVPEGTHRLFLVFRHPTATGALMNLNWFKFTGKGAAVTAPPEVTASADPATGDAPLEVTFDAQATDAEGEALTYEWNFGVAGTTEDTSTEEDPTYTYQAPGNYTATVTVTDASGGEASASVPVRVTRGLGECPPTNARSDEFEGDSLDLNRWEIIRPDDTRPPTVSGGELHFPIDTGSIYEAGTTARNIVVQPLPDGDVEVTAKITTEPLTQDYHQAGLRVYSSDNHWASVHMIHAGGQRDFEFIYENNGTARNGSADKLGGIPETFPLTYWVKLISDGSTLRAEYSDDGEEFLPVGQTADISGWSNVRVGPVALSGDSATTFPVAHFDWIRFDPDETGGGGGSETELFADEFNGTELGAGWDVVRGSQARNVSGGALRIPAATGDLYQGNNTAADLVLRDVPASAPWTATAKINFEGLAQYQQAGIMVYGDDDNLVKLGRIAHTTAGDEKFEFIHEAGAVADNTAADSTANIATDFPDDYWVQLRYDGTNLTGWYSQNGTDYLQAGRAWPLPANAQIGVFAFGNTATSAAPEAAFDSFRITRPGAPGGLSRDDEFDGSGLDKARWDAIVRDVPAEYEVAGGELTITTSPGDIYGGDTNPPPNNFILQDAAHAGADWTIETRISRATINGGWGQGGLLAYVDGDHYVKLDAIADNDFAGNRINRIELRTEDGAAPTGPPGQADPAVPEGTTDIRLRLTKTGTSYAGEYSFDGTTWTPMGAVTNTMAAPDFGLFALGPQPNGVGDTVSFDYFWLNGQDTPTDPCECVPTGGDAFDGPLDKQKWNAIVREQEDLYSFNDGWLEITTVNGDIYEDGPPAPTRNFILQEPTEPGQDWVIETHVDAATLSENYEQAGLMARVDDDNYVKFDILSDQGQTVLNRIELRTEVDSVVAGGQPQLSPLPAGTTEVWLRLTKSGTNYSGEYSFNGQDWVSIGAPVVNEMEDPAFGIFTLGVNSGGGTARFEYFSLDGNATGCEEPEPENRAPAIADATASPQTGFAPLEVDFSVTASDPDEGDTLTYAWDFDGDGDTDSTEEDPTHTYTAAGEYEAEVTVSDGEAERSRTVPVSVFSEDLEPGADYRVLVFSKTAGFRHDSIDEGHAAIEQLGEDNGFQVDHTEDASIFNADALAHYDTVVWLSTTGDVLNAAQQSAFEDYIQGGGGFTGIHAAADTEYDWKWYGNLVGGYFLSHPPGTPNADVIVEDADDHTTDHLDGPVWNRDDEWYNYKPVNFEETGNVDYSPRAGGVHVLLTVDESTYDEQDGNTTDDDHPISWCKRYDGGRSWYTGMGHTAASFSEDDYLQHILGGIEVSAGAAASEECGAQDPDAPIVQAFGDPTSGSVPLEVQFTSTAIDPNGPRLADTAFRWTFGDGSSRFGRTPVHTYRQAGVYTATLTVTDPEGKKTSDTVQITVNPQGNLLPIVEAAADPASGDPPLTVDFEAVAIDPDGPEDRITYEWDFGDGTGGQFGRVVSHTYRSAGEYTAEVTATDERGGSATATIEVTVDDPPGNQAPTVRALADPTSGPAPLRVRLSSNPADVEDGDNLLVVWDFGDGKSGGGDAVFHTYTSPGTYTAKVTVTDTDGATASDTVAINVTARARGGQDVAPSPPPPSAADVEGETETRPSVRLTRRHKVARVVKRGLRYTVACETACRVTSTLRIAGADNQRLGKAAARRIAAGDSRRFVLRLDRTVRRNLASAMRKAKLRNLRATLVLKISTAEGTTTVRKAIVLRR